MKLGQGGAACLATKISLGWELYTKEHHLRLMPKRNIKVHAALDTIPTKARQFSLRKWWHLLRILRSITLVVSRAYGMFTRLKHALRQAQVRRVQLSTSVQEKLSAWSQIVH